MLWQIFIGQGSAWYPLFSVCCHVEFDTFVICRGDKTRYTLVYRHSYVSCNVLIELMFLLLDVYVSSSFGRSGTTWFKCSSLRASLLTDSRVVCANREIKLDVTWSYIKLQPAKMTSQFVFFSSNPLLKHMHKNRKMSPTIRRKYKYFHSTVQRAKDRRQKFHFCRLT